MAAAPKFLTAPDIAFAQAGDLARLQAGWRPDVLLFVANLDDPTLRDCLALAPNAADLMDEAFPGATLRDAFLQRRALTRSLLAMRLSVAADGVEIAYDPAGGPRVMKPAGAGFVSVSSRSRWVAVALADQPVGVDLELIAPRLEPVWDVLHGQERARLRACEMAARPRAFFEIWTAKEAGLKALGFGLRRDPSSILSEIDEDGAFALRDGEAVIATGQLMPTDDRVVAVACL